MTIRILDMLEEIKDLIKDKLSDRWLNIREVASYASVSETTIRRAAKRSKTIPKCGLFFISLPIWPKTNKIHYRYH